MGSVQILTKTWIIFIPDNDILKFGYIYIHLTNTSTTDEISKGGPAPVSFRKSLPTTLVHNLYRPVTCTQ